MKKDMKTIKKNKSEMKDTLIEMKNTLTEVKIHYRESTVGKMKQRIKSGIWKIKK